LRKAGNVSLAIFIYGIILICMFVWLNRTFERKETEEISEDIKKEIWRQIGLLEKICSSTDDINQILNVGRQHVSYLRFVGKPGIPMITEVLLNKKKDWKLRFILAQLLSNMNSKTVIAPLNRILNDETDIKNIRVASAIVLGSLKFDEVSAPLLKVAKGNDKELQLAAIYGLGELRNEKVVNELKKWIVNEKDLQIKKELELAIKKFCNHSPANRNFLNSN